MRPASYYTKTTTRRDVFVFEFADDTVSVFDSLTAVSEFRGTRLLTCVLAGMARKRQIEVYVDDELYQRIKNLDEPTSAYFRRLAEDDLGVTADAD